MADDDRAMKRLRQFHEVISRGGPHHNLCFYRFEECCDRTSYDMAMTIIERADDGTVLSAITHCATCGIREREPGVHLGEHWHRIPYEPPVTTASYCWAADADECRRRGTIAFGQEKKEEWAG